MTKAEISTHPPSQEPRNKTEEPESFSANPYSPEQTLRIDSNLFPH